MIRLTEELEQKILDALMDGKSMRQIADTEGMPSRSTMLRWMADESIDFGAKCARARELQAEVMDDMVLDAAKACDESNYQSTKVKISAYQWRASKLAPKKYGDKVQQEVTGADGGPIQSEHRIIFVEPGK
jgi:hypothetical protein